MFHLPKPIFSKTFLALKAFFFCMFLTVNLDQNLHRYITLIFVSFEKFHVPESYLSKCAHFECQTCQIYQLSLPLESF